MGQTLPIATSPIELARPIPAGSAEVTLVSMTESRKIPGQTTRLDPDQEFAILTFKVTNTGQDKFDTYVLTNARWTGKDGLAVDAQNGYEPSGQGTVVPYESFVNQSEPAPGEYMRGTEPLVIPGNQPGTLHFADRNGYPLFDIATAGSE